MTRGGFTLDTPDLRVEERCIGFMALRLHRSDPAAVDALAHAFGEGWPERPNTTAGVDPAIAWVGPAEWAILDAPGDTAERITAAAGACLHHLCDLSSGVRAWRIEGRRARELLACGTGLDTHPRVFRRGECGRTRLADVAVFLVAAGPDAFDLVADVSLAAYLRAWLQDAAQGSAQ